MTTRNRIVWTGYWKTISSNLPRKGRASTVPPSSDALGGGGIGGQSGTQDLYLSLTERGQFYLTVVSVSFNTL